MYNKTLAFGIILLFVLSSMPSLFGYDIESTEVVFEESSPMDIPWPMQGYDRRHTGRSPYSTSSNTGVEIWRFKTGRFGWINGGSIIGNDGTIYFGSGDNKLYALNPDGTEKWNYSINFELETTPAIGDDGTIYLPDSYVHFYAINPNGTIKWKFNMNDDCFGAPIIGDDGRIYFGTEEGKLFSLNPDGSEYWHFTTSADIVSSPAIADDGTIYIGSYNGDFYAVYPNGTQRWRFHRNGIIMNDIAQVFMMCL